MEIMAANKHVTASSTAKWLRWTPSLDQSEGKRSLINQEDKLDSKHSIESPLEPKRDVQLTCTQLAAPLPARRPQ